MQRKRESAFAVALAFTLALARPVRAEEIDGSACQPAVPCRCLCRQSVSSPCPRAHTTVQQTHIFYATVEQDPSQPARACWILPVAGRCVSCGFCGGGGCGAAAAAALVAATAAAAAAAAAAVAATPCAAMLRARVPALVPLPSPAPAPTRAQARGHACAGAALNTATVQVRSMPIASIAGRRRRGRQDVVVTIAQREVGALRRRWLLQFFAHSHTQRPHTIVVQVGRLCPRRQPQAGRGALEQPVCPRARPPATPPSPPYDK